MTRRPMEFFIFSDPKFLKLHSLSEAETLLFKFI